MIRPDAPEQRVRFRVLGPLEVVVDGEALSLGGPKQGLVLALLLLETGRVVSTDRLVEAVWDEAAAQRSLATLQVYVSNLRRALEPASRALGLPEIIVTRRPGYLVAVPAEHVDVAAFAGLVREARDWVRAGNPDRAGVRYREALSLWRGDPLEEFEQTRTVDALRARLAGERQEALIEGVDADLAGGRHAAVLGQLRAAVAENPLDERLCGQLMLALYRSGRQAEALSTFTAARSRLVDELGIDPGRELCTLERQILAQDPALDLPRPAGPLHAPGDQMSSTVLRSVSRASSALLVDGQRVPLVRTVTTIGRRDDRHIVLAGDEVSRAHAELRQSDGGVDIVDVGSANGIRVNGVRVPRARLRSGDLVVIGDHVLEFEGAEPADGGHAGS